ncbi:MAG: hypothetical protein ACRCZ2_00425, partial [Fusobacteriaceae bacterium]
VCKIPHLHLDERIQIIGYEFDPVANKRTKIFAGYKAKGISGTINDSVVEQMKPIIDDVDEQLQAEIDKSNAAIDKEYADRVQDVQDAIDKAEADAEAMKEQIRGEIAQEWKEWDEEWELAKENIDNSIENVSKELGLYIESTDEIIGGINDTITALDGSLTDISDNFDNYVESTDQVLSGLGSDLSGLINENVAQGESITKIIDNQEEFTRQIGVWENGEDGTLRAYISANTQTAKEISTSLGEWNVDEKGDTVAKFVTDVTQSAQEIKESLGSWQNGETGTVIGHLTNVIKTAEGITETIGTWTEDGTGETLSKALLEVKKTADGVKTTVGTWDNPANGTVIKKVSEVEQTANGVKTTIGAWDSSTNGGSISEVLQTASGLSSTVSSHTNQLNGSTDSALKTLATKAEADAKAANDVHKEASNDNKLTPVEKQQAKKEWDIITGLNGEYAKIKVNAE